MKARDLNFMEGEQVLLKVSPIKSVMWFVKRVGEVSYELALPPGLSGVHPAFHMSMLKKYYGDRNYIIHWDTILLDENPSYKEEHVVILDRVFRKLRSREIASIKVQ